VQWKGPTLPLIVRPFELRGLIESRSVADSTSKHIAAPKGQEGVGPWLVAGMEEW
jgi:hypothetical protein